MGRVLTIVLLGMAVDNALLLWKARVHMAQGYFDFANFYTAGKLVRRGQSAELYDSGAQWRVQQEFFSQVNIRRAPMRYLRPPFEALFFSVFAAWPYPTALLVFTVLTLALLAAIPFIVVRGRRWQEGFPLGLTPILIVGTFPAFMDLIMGQDAALLALLFALCFWQLETGRDVWAGATLGLALFKFQLALPFFFVLWIAGRKRVVAGFLLSASILCAISTVIVGWRGVLKYPGYLLALSHAKGVGISPEIQITLRGLLTFLGKRVSDSRSSDWMLAAVAVGAIVYTGLLWRRAGESFLAEGFGLGAIIAIVTSYYASDYDLLVLIVPLLAMRTRPGAADARRADSLTRYLETSGLLLLLLTPLYWFTRLQLHAECLMTIPLLAVGVALARRLRDARAGRLIAGDTE
ncbi:MAG: glycosyltransferase family 87 protein [Terriglobales bacterium]